MAIKSHLPWSATKYQLYLLSQTHKIKTNQKKKSCSLYQTYLVYLYI